MKKFLLMFSVLAIVFVAGCQTTGKAGETDIDQAVCTWGACLAACPPGQIQTPGTPAGQCNQNIVDSVPFLDLLHENKYCLVCAPAGNACSDNKPFVPPSSKLASAKCCQINADCKKFGIDFCYASSICKKDSDGITCGTCSFGGFVSSMAESGGAMQGEQGFILVDPKDGALAFAFVPGEIQNPKATLTFSTPFTVESSNQYLYVSGHSSIPVVDMIQVYATINGQDGQGVYLTSLAGGELSPEEFSVEIPLSDFGAEVGSQISAVQFKIDGVASNSGEVVYITAAFSPS